MTPDPLLRPLESLLNRNIADSARARGLLAQVAGKSIEIRVAATPFHIRIQATDERVAIATGGDAPADAMIEGTPLALARLAAPKAAEAFRSGGLQISGDAERQYACAGDQHRSSQCASVHDYGDSGNFHRRKKTFRL